MNEKLINRELSWLEFNQRVLNEANCQANPLLERLKFLAITGSNLDEFFMVRVGGLKILKKHDSDRRTIDGFSASEQLDLIGERVRVLKTHQYLALDAIELELKQEGLQRLTIEQLSADQMAYVNNRFADEFQSVFAPIALSAESEFPLLLKSKLAILVRIAGDATKTLGAESDDNVAGDPQADSQGHSDDRFAVIPVGGNTSRLISVPSKDRFQFVALEDVIMHSVAQFFPGQKILETGAFRVFRNADIQLDEDRTNDLLAGMQQVLTARKTSDCVLLEVSDSMSDAMVVFLTEQLDIDSSDCYPISGPLDLSAMWELVGVQGYENLRDPQWPPHPVPDFQSDRDIFETISEKDRMMFHPYQSFDPVVRFLRTAADDPDVIAIKQTLYRTSRDSAIVDALMQAARNGKSVTAIVELKARFDEERNIRWARKLEHAGVDVIYGVKGLKTHAKCCIVVRKEPSGIRRYVHFGTGNYNEVTANIYSDISLLTCDEQLGNDAVAFFNAVTGFSLPQPLHRLIAAPIDLRQSLSGLIEDELRRAKAGKTAMISAKLNSLVDRKIIELLYRASRAGVKIRLNIRGICCLRPGVKDLSENISVCSIVDRFLEHSRIFHFHAGGESKVYISSADWMSRNLNRRVELMTPVLDPDCKARTLDLLEIYFRDNVKNHFLNSDGTYQLIEAGQREAVRSQEKIYQLAQQWVEDSERSQATVFLPHRGDSESA